MGRRSRHQHIPKTRSVDPRRDRQTTPGNEETKQNTSQLRHKCVLQSTARTRLVAERRRHQRNSRSKSGNRQKRGMDSTTSAHQDKRANTVDPKRRTLAYQNRSSTAQNVGQDVAQSRQNAGIQTGGMASQMENAAASLTGHSHQPPRRGRNH